MKALKQRLVLSVLAGVIALGSVVSVQAADLYEQLKTNKVVRVGTEGTYPPFTFHDSKKDNVLTGFDVELAKEVFKRAGIEKVEFVEGPWDGLIAGVDADRYDAVVNQVGITPERQEKYDFSNPYISSPMVVIAREDETGVTKLEDIKGKNAAQTLTSNFGKKAKALGAEIISVDGFAQSIDLLTSKRADLTLNDRLSFLDFKKQKPDAPVKIVATDSEPANSGILVKKGNPELVAAINKALDEIKADGTYAKISEQFFGVDVSKP
ncbi:amino acid ABC transporter substrate-binding protein [uncultured Thiothrix sp.]|uniref:amino acid ABC transporter substrate-binding protein n=1 Tax=uncultured Thiothrix sp. TaxID=223185 RepID=UPI00262C373B|nr:amino acid ABC transporter substrate-binding protein [uncultured Thiothrix sp.]